MVGFSRSAIGRILREGGVSINNAAPRKAGQMLDPGDVVLVQRVTPNEELTTPSAADVPRVIYEDEFLLAIDKPAGLPVHPGPGHSVGTLVDRLLALGTPLSQSAGDERPGIVHRLDKETSGVMLVAKNDAVHAVLAKQFALRDVQKTYLALLRGRLLPEEGMIDAPIGRDPGNRQRMAIVTKGREAQTGFRVVRHLGDRSLVVARPQTGRPHQIRVHFSSIGHPVVGDPVYGRGRGRRRHDTSRMFLHSFRLRFEHPVSQASVVVEATLAPDLEADLRTMAGADYEALMEEIASA